MVCLGIKPRTVEWQAQMNPLSYAAQSYHCYFSKQFHQKYVRISVTRKKLPNVYKSCPKMISQEKLMTLTHLQILPKNVRDLDKLIVSKGFKK